MGVCGSKPFSSRCSTSATAPYSYPHSIAVRAAAPDGCGSTTLNNFGSLQEKNETGEYSSEQPKNSGWRSRKQKHRDGENKRIHRQRNCVVRNGQYDVPIVESSNNTGLNNDNDSDAVELSPRTTRIRKIIQRAYDKIEHEKRMMMSSGRTDAVTDSAYTTTVAISHCEEHERRKSFPITAAPVYPSLQHSTTTAELNPSLTLSSSSLTSSGQTQLQKLEGNRTLASDVIPTNDYTNAMGKQDDEHIILDEECNRVDQDNKSVGAGSDPTGGTSLTPKDEENQPVSLGEFDHARAIDDDVEDVDDDENANNTIYLPSLQRHSLIPSVAQSFDEAAQKLSMKSTVIEGPVRDDADGIMADDAQHQSSVMVPPSTSQLSSLSSATATPGPTEPAALPRPSEKPVRIIDLVDDDTNTDDGITNKNNGQQTLLRLANRLLKKLNHDPWDEFNKYNDVDVCDYIHHHPETVTITYDFTHFSGYIYPLSVLSALGASLKTIEHVYTIYPRAMEECDLWIGTPLHYACSHRANSIIVKFLVSKYPSMLQKRNQFGRTPLHMACLFKATAKTVTILLQMYPRAVVIPEKDGYTPLHLACENGASADVVSLLVQSSPDTCLAVTERTRSTPLHLACSCHNANKTVIQVLLSSSSSSDEEWSTFNGSRIGTVGSSAARCLDAQGMLPLHLAVKNQASVGVIELLVRAAPESVHVLSGGGSAGNGDGVATEAGGGGHGGLTAYRIAKRNCAPDVVLQMLAV